MRNGPKILDLKSTLNLPRTAFPMKANLPQSEPKLLAQWESSGLYRRILESRAGAPLYMLHDGPPYPTGNIHLGTGLNKILKDMVVKSKTMAGFRAPYVPGWDCHGLPIETQVEKELGQKGSVSPVEFRRHCREFATRYVDAHRRDFKRLGVFGRWEDPYLTMSPDCEAAIADVFVTMLEKGYIYRGLKPVYWCIYDRTALAEAEVEYQDHTSPSVWVKFPLVEDAAGAKLGPGVSAVIWTTTPWTLPHNRALAFHPAFEYVVVETSAGALLVAADRLQALERECRLEVGKERGRWKGRELEGLSFRHPFLELRVPGVLGEYVTLEQGTATVGPAALTERLLGMARRLGLELAWGVKADATAYPRELVRELVPACKVIVLNSAELAVLGQHLRIRGADDLLRLGVKVVVLTRGADGCDVWWADGMLRQAALRPDRVVDTTGSGDALTSGFLAAYWQTGDLARAAQWGAANAAAVLAQPGSQTGLCTAEELERRLVEGSARAIAG